MAVPSAVKRKREQLEAELGLTPNPEQTPSVDLNADPPVLETVPPPSQPVVATQSDERDARIAELEHLLKTRDGQASKSMQETNEARSRMEMLANQVATMEETIVELQKQKDTAEALATAKRADSDLPSLDDGPDLSPEEIEKFGDDSVGFVNKLTKRQLLSYVKPLLSKVQALEKSLARLSDLDRLPQLETVVKNAQVEAQRVKDEEFFRVEVLNHFPDFAKVRGTQEWQNYIATDIPGKGIKIGHLLNHYRLSHDASNIRAILQGYYDQTKSKPELSSLAVPSKTQTEGSPVSKPKMKASDYNAKLRMFTSRQLPKADWESYKTEFTTALNEGRVDMDARL